MDPFSVESFVEKPSLKVVCVLKKSQLAQHFNLELTTTMKKSEVKQLVIDYLVDEELVPDEELEATSDHDVSENTVELKRLELAEKERESQLRLKELEPREKELNVQKELEAPSRPSVTTQTVEPPHISKQIRFVPPFQEKEVDKYLKRLLPA